MALRVRNIPHRTAIRLSTAVLIDLSLRNHLCLSVLQTEHGTAFHLGTIVRTMFASFYLFDAGFGDGDLSTFTEADILLGELAMSRSLESSYRLRSHAVQPTARLLALYDNQLQTAPLVELVSAHQRAERNFHASSDVRLSIPVLIQRFQKRQRDTHGIRCALSP
jgi:hypothetical protein